MAEHYDKFGVAVEVNGEQAREEIKRISDLISKLQEQKAKLNSVGDTEGAKVIQKSINEQTKELRKFERDLKAVDRVMKNMSGATLKELQGALRIVQTEMQKTPRNTRQYRELTKQMTRLKTEIGKVNSETKASTSLLSKMGVLANRFQAFVWGTSAAITGLSLTIRQVVKDYSDMEEEMANVQKYTGMTSEEVHNLNEEFKKLDTRTSREQLNRLAGDAGRLGIQSKEAIMEFVDGADKIQVALGDDLGETAVRDIGKLAQMFGEDKTKGLRGAMLATGSAVNELAQNSSASAGYIVDFTARLSGVGKQAGLTQSQIMGYASVLDQNMQNQETAATAMSQLLTKMMQDTEKFARLAGRPVKEFAKTLREDANTALLQFLEAMQAKGGFADLAPMFEGMGLNGSRATGILSVLASKLQDVKTAQDLATKSYEEGTSVLNEYNRMNTTVEAEIDKAKKRFHDLSVELGQRLLPIAKYAISSSSLLVKVLSTLADFVYKNKTLIIGATASLVAYNVAVTASATWTKVCATAHTLWNGCFALFNSLAKTATVISLAYHVAVAKLTGNITRAAAAQKLLNASMSANVIGAILAGVVALTTAIVILVDKIKNANKAAMAMKNISDGITKGMVDEEAKIRSLVETIKSQTASETAKKEALEQLNALMPEHLRNITEEDVRTGKANANIREYLKLARERIRLELIEDELRESMKRQRELEKRRDAYAQNEGNLSGYEGLANSQMLDELNKKIQKEQELQDKLFGKSKTPSLTIYKPSAGGTDTTTTTDNTLSDKELKKQEAARRKAETAFNRATKEGEDRLKAQTQTEIASLMARYAKGEVLARDYQDELYKIQEKGLQQRIDFLLPRDVDAAHKLQDDLERMKQAHEQKLDKIDAVAIEQREKAREISLKEMFYDENSDIYMNEQALEEALFQSQLNALQERQKLYKQGTDEWEQVENDIVNMENKHRLDKTRQYHDLLSAMNQRYGKQDFEQQKMIVLNGIAYIQQIEIGKLDELHRNNLITEEQYQEELLALKKKYAEMGMAVEAEYSSYQVKNTAPRQSAMNAVTTARNKGQTAENKYVDANHGSPFTQVFGGIVENLSTTKEALKAFYEEGKMDYAEYQQACVVANADAMQRIMQQTQVMADGISSILSGLSSYYSASCDLEIAESDKKYDAEISAAGKNQKKIKKIEEQKAKEQAAIKSKYNKMAMKIEIAQAIAQGAMAAINAYSSAAAVPVIGYILAPIAAAMALASTALQIEAIKKQHQAQEVGYYEGGFTGGRRYRKEAGVVHEGEFVANHNAVNNPNVMPVLDLIDRAQKNNTIGTLTAEDISRSVGAPGTTNVVQVTPQDNAQVQETLDRLSVTIEDLRHQLSEGITAVAAIDGKNGVANQLKKYNRLMANR